MPKVRRGKTKKDLLSGASERCISNRRRRDTWCVEGGVFPREVCNGKKNRHRITGRGGSTVFI